MVIDANTGVVLHDQDGDELRHPASLTKMMTLFIVFEEIEAGRLSYDTRLSISQKAASVAPSKLELKAGDEITVINAIKALITKSANDVAVALAEHISGNEADFARRMTTRARQIGMSATVFRNASGLPDDDQVTTARDMLTLAMRLQDDFPKHYPLFSLQEFTYGGKTLRNHNTLMGRFPGMDGIKTGYTRASGFNLVSSVHTNGRYVVAAVFGGASAAVRNAHMRIILFHALEKASTERTRKSAPTLIARAKPAERPAPRSIDAHNRDTRPVEVAQAAPNPVTRKTAPSPTDMAPAKATPAVKPEPQKQVALPLEIAAQTEPEPVAPPVIQIAKVRAVQVAPLAANATTASPSSPAATPVPSKATATATPKIDFAALKSSLAAARNDAATVAPANERQSGAPAATLPPADNETVMPMAIAGTSGRPPSTLAEQAALLEMAGAPVPEPAVHAQAVRLAAPAVATSGLPPSSLADQARRLQSTGDEPPVERREAALQLRGPISDTPAPPPVAAGAFEIQIGAFSTVSEAERQIAAARGAAPRMLAGHAPLARPVNAARSMYRARFAGFDADKASRACRELRRLSFDCFVARPE